MSARSLRPGRQIWPLFAVGILVWSAAPADTAAPVQLPRSDAARDPVWVERLPPVTLPLPRLSAMVDGAAQPPAPGSAVPVSGVDQAAAAAVGPGSRTVSTAATVEVAEDSSRVEVLERQAIAASGEDAGARAPAVPAPAAAVVPVTPVRAVPPSAPGYRWQVQLLAGRSLDKVRADWRIFVQRQRAMLEGLTLTISQSRFGDARDDFYRLRVLDWTDKTAADRWCARLRAAGGQCFVTRVTALPE